MYRCMCICVYVCIYIYACSASFEFERSGPWPWRYLQVAKTSAGKDLSAKTSEGIEFHPKFPQSKQLWPRIRHRCRDCRSDVQPQPKFLPVRLCKFVVKLEPGNILATSDAETSRGSNFAKIPEIQSKRRTPLPCTIDTCLCLWDAAERFM